MQRLKNFYEEAYIKKNSKVKKRVITKDNDVLTVYKTKNHFWLLFKASDDFLDWKSNLKFYRKNKKVHPGMYRSAKKFFPEIDKYIVKKQCCFGGYSRGADLALICAVRCATLHKYKDTFCFTMGQEMTYEANEAKAKASLRRLYYCRTYFKHDPIVHLPGKLFNCAHLPQVGDRITHVELPSKWWHKIPLIWIKILVHRSYFKKSK